MAVLLGLHPIARSRLRVLQQLARQAGISITITSAVRDSATQAELYRRWISGDPRQRLPAAPPGTSTHEYGLAVDIVSSNQEVLVWLAQLAGWVWAGQKDPVHFQIVDPGFWRRLVQQALAG